MWRLYATENTRQTERFTLTAEHTYGVTNGSFPLAQSIHYGRSHAKLRMTDRSQVAVPERTFAELPTSALLNRVLIWQPIGLLLMVVHVLFVRQSVWLFPVAPLLLGWVYLNAPLAGALVFFQILIYQNLIVSLFSPGMDYMPTYVSLGGTNFVALCVIAVIAMNRLMTSYWWQKSRGVIWLVLLALAMTTVYTAIGAAKAGPTSALVYFRTFTSPLFAVIVGLDLGRAWGFKTIATAFIFSVVVSIGLSILEYAIPLDYYGWMNEVSYYQLKWGLSPDGPSFWVPQDIVNAFTNVFFNVAGTSPSESVTTTFRFGGSIITPTSFAYILSVVGLVAVSLRRSAWLLVILPLMFLDGAKGASLLLILSLLVWMVWALTANKPMVLICGLILIVAYVSFGLISGFRNEDYHVVGFMGGVHSLASTPFGHGMGVGGNMSAQAAAGFKMDGPGGFTKLGADFALESAVGVLFYQTGFASIFMFAVFIGLLYAAPLGELRGDRLVPVRRDILFFAVAMIMVNGIFQEEAYSPYTAGTIMLLCSVLIGNGRRPSAIYSALTRRFDYKRAAA